MEKNRTLFLDESGKATFQHSSKHFVLSAFSVPTSKIADLERSVDKITFKYWGSPHSYSQKFGVKKINFHAIDIYKRTGPFKILNEPPVNKEFWKDIHTQILSKQYISYYMSYVDKRTKKSSTTWTEDTILRKSYDFILESFLNHLILTDSYGEIIAESSSEQDISLVKTLNTHQRTSKRIYNDPYLVNEKITKLSLVNKYNNSIGSQIADLMAWTAPNKIMAESGKPPKFRFEEKLLLEMLNKRLLSKANCYKYDTFKAL